MPWYREKATVVKIGSLHKLASCAIEQLPEDLDLVNGSSLDGRGTRKGRLRGGFDFTGTAVDQERHNEGAGEEEREGGTGQAMLRGGSPRASCSFLLSASLSSRLCGLRTPSAPMTSLRARAALVWGRSLAGRR